MHMKTREDIDKKRTSLKKGGKIGGFNPRKNRVNSNKKYILLVELMYTYYIRHH